MKKTKAYKASMTNGDYIKIDEDEIDKVSAAIEKRSFCFVRSGMINSVHVVGIHLDKDRIQDWLHACGYGDETGKLAQDEGIKPLKSIFEGTQLGRKMEEADKLRAQGLNATIGFGDKPILVPKGAQLLDHEGNIVHDNSK